MKNDFLTKKYKGVVSVVFTPCKQPGVVDSDAMRNYCSILSNTGCNGIFVLGSTGCLPLLDENDRKEMLLAARKGTPSSIVLFAGISGMGCKDTIKYAKQAAESGADIAVVMAPFFLKLSQEQLFAYISEVADNSPIPISLYHHLRMPTGFEISTVTKLSQHPNIVGIKDTSRDINRLKEIISTVTNNDFCVFQGHERLILQSMQAGASGCLTALAGIVPQLHAKIIENWLIDNIREAQKFQDLITAMTETLLMSEEVSQSIGHFEYALKYLAHLQGWLDEPYSIIKGWNPADGFNEKIQITFNDLIKSNA